MTAPRSGSAGSAETSCDGRPRPPLSGPGCGSATTHEVRDQLKEQLGLPNIMLVPRFEKIVLNMGVGRATQQPSLLEAAVRDLTIITGQKPLVTKAKKSIAGFKLREGNAIGAKVTLAGRPDVGVLRPARQPGHPAYPGLPGPAHQGLRRPRQLHLRHHRAAHLPRDRLRQGRHPAGDGHHHRHHGTDQREGRALLDAFGFPFRRDGAL